MRTADLGLDLRAGRPPRRLPRRPGAGPAAPAVGRRGIHRAGRLRGEQVMSSLRPGGGTGGTGRVAGYGRLAPVRPPADGYGGARPGGRGGPAMGRRGLLARALAKDSVVRHMDWVLIAAVLALALIGTLLIWSATRTGLEQAGGNPNTYLEKQLLNVAIGLVLLVAVSLVDYRILRMYTPLVYAAACLGLLVVLSPLGATVNGAHSWIALPGGFQIEPSEFAKIGMILMLAVILGELHDRATRPGALEVALALA